MRTLLSHKIALPAAYLLAGAFWLAGQTFGSQATATQQPETATGDNLGDMEERAGPFSIAPQNYTVVLREKRIPRAGETPFNHTLARLEIQDANGNIAFQKEFPTAIGQGRVERSLSASAELVAGKTGAGLVIHYRDDSVPAQPGPRQTKETWQFFGLVNGKLTLFAKPALIGQAGTSGPFMGVVMRAANGAATVIGQPDTFELSVWTGYFFVFIPLRVDWRNGGLAQGQRCVRMLGGSLHEVGCAMRVRAPRKPPSDEYTFARVFAEANDQYEAEHVVLRKNSKVEILEASAITNWDENAEMIQPVLSDLWLHVRIGEHGGWIHGAEDFAAVGLPAGSPAP